MVVARADDRLERRILSALSQSGSSGFELCRTLDLSPEDERRLYPVLNGLAQRNRIVVETDLTGRRLYRPRVEGRRKRTVFKQVPEGA